MSYLTTGPRPDPRWCVHPPSLVAMVLLHQPPIRRRCIHSPGLYSETQQAKEEHICGSATNIRLPRPPSCHDRRVPPHRWVLLCRRSRVQQQSSNRINRNRRCIHDLYNHQLSLHQPDSRHPSGKSPPNQANPSECSRPAQPYSTSLPQHSKLQPSSL